MDPQFQKFRRREDTHEHVVPFIDSMVAHSNNSDLCLREFSKSLIDNAL